MTVPRVLILTVVLAVAAVGCGGDDGGTVDGGTVDGAAIGDSDINLSLEADLEGEVVTGTSYGEAVGDPDLIGVPEITTDCPDEEAAELECDVSGEEISGTITVSPDDDESDELEYRGTLKTPLGPIEVSGFGIPVDG